MESGDHGLLDRRPSPRARRRDVLQRHQLLQIRGRSVTWLVPLVVLVAISLADVNTTGEFRIVSWCVFVAAIASALCGVWTTALFAALALLTYVASDAAWPSEYREGPADFVLVLVGGVLSVLAASVRVRGERRMLHMMDIAETTRRTVLRPLPPRWGGLDHAAVYLAADADARVGGDFYDIQPGPHGTRLLIGDVQGKGLGAVEAAAALLGTFREAAFHEPDLAVVACRLEQRMRRHRLRTVALGRTDGDRFATAVLIGFPEGEDSAVEIVGFGHEPALAIGGPRGVRELPYGDGVPVGIGELLGRDEPPPVLRADVAPDETLLLVTDGVTEARDSAGEFYPLAEDVAAALARDPRTAEPDRLVAVVRDGTLRHCGGRLADDTTVFAVRRVPPGAG
ncbi:Serine phosphatase RsbU, regulator of sigma subunit [Streptomyces sp. yr375]|uniref:PP2C family protein-serine/threonine phosphatase n=1 Tax=Streptomyces sp. yr375 TaxID=1761906 RepID=UPI0008C2B8D4|nr:PP2C family protein-serine/threonine phosphatase [Streptomyces sp. yr375]SES48922.1 Serine phosphatase RsbU, regulator of sigma subunit [Streptomyces sp. yr375]